MDDKNSEPAGVPPVGEDSAKAQTPVNATLQEPSSPAEAPQTEVEQPKPEPSQQKSPDDLNSIDIENGMGDSPRPKELIPKKPKKSMKKPLIILVVIIVLAILGYLAMQFLNKDKTVATKSTNSSNNTPPSTETKTEPTPTLKIYKNDKIKIELSYPSNWTIKELTSEVVLTSPSGSYTKKDGTTTKGPFRMLVQKGISTADNTTVNASVAVKTSELISYGAPADGQRKTTYLSFLGKTKDAFSFFVISSGKQYNPGDKVSGTLPLGQESYVIAGGYGTSADDNLGFDAVAVDKIDQSTTYTQVVEIVKSLKLL